MTRILSVLLVFLLIGSARAELALVGRVVDASSNAIGRAVVRATPVDDEGLPATAFADEAGAFSLPLERGAYEVALAGDRFSSWISDPVAVVASEALSTNELLIVARMGLRIEGRVVTPDGAGVADAAVMATGMESTRAPGIAWTDDSGAFVVAGLDPGEMHVSAEGPGGEKVSTAVTATAGLPATNIVLVLASGGIDGVVRDSAGNPLPGRTVLAASRHEAIGLERTDDGGAFRFRGLSDGDYVVMTMAIDGEAPMRRVPVVVSEGRVTGGIILQPGELKLCGRLLDDEAEPVGGAMIRVEPLDEELEAASIHANVVTDEEGRFCASNLYAGAYSVFAMARVRGWVRANRVAVTPDAGEMSLILGGGGELVGRVVDDAGVIVTGALVHAVLPGDAEIAGASGVTDAEGRFRFPRVRPGEYRLFALAGGRLTPWANVDVRPASKPAETELPLVSKGSVLSGRVMNERAPVTNAPVVVRHHWGLFIAPVETTDAEGRFSVPSLPGGQYQLRVFTPALGSVRRDVHVGDDTTVEVEIDLAGVE